MAGVGVNDVGLPLVLSNGDGEALLAACYTLGHKPETVITYMQTLGRRGDAAALSQALRDRRARVARQIRGVAGGAAIADGADASAELMARWRARGVPPVADGAGPE
jgi:hypothetical protein